MWNALSSFLTLFHRVLWLYSMAIFSVSSVLRHVTEIPQGSISLLGTCWLFHYFAQMKNHWHQYRLKCINANEIPLVLCGGYGSINLLPPTVKGLLHYREVMWLSKCLWVSGRTGIKLVHFPPYLCLFKSQWIKMRWPSKSTRKQEGMRPSMVKAPGMGQSKRTDKTTQTLSSWPFPSSIKISKIQLNNEKWCPK